MRVYIILFSFLLSSCSLAIKRATRLNNEVKSQHYHCDAIIVPGVPLKGGIWDSTMKARVMWSVYLYKQKSTRNIIYSGAAVYTPFYEAIAMGLYAQKMGVPKEHIFYDTLARHSTENVFYSYKLAQQLGFKSIALATDPFQSVILKAFTRRRFMSNIQHIPVDFSVLPTMQHTDPFIDSMTAYKPNFTSIIHEENIMTRLMGTFGKQIDFGPDDMLGPL